MKTFITFFAAVIFLSVVFDAVADGQVLIDGRTGKYLGKLNNNQFDPDSVSNKFGRYGSKFSPESVNNKFGQYCSKYSNDSGNNPYATNPPIIIDNH